MPESFIAKPISFRNAPEQVFPCHDCIYQHIDGIIAFRSRFQEAAHADWGWGPCRMTLQRKWSPTTPDASLAPTAL